MSIEIEVSNGKASPESIVESMRISLLSFFDVFKDKYGKYPTDDFIEASEGFTNLSENVSLYKDACADDNPVSKELIASGALMYLMDINEPAEAISVFMFRLGFIAGRLYSDRTSAEVKVEGN